MHSEVQGKNLYFSTLEAKIYALEKERRKEKKRKDKDRKGKEF